MFDLFHQNLRSLQQSTLCEKKKNKKNDIYHQSDMMWHFNSRALVRQNPTFISRTAYPASALADSRLSSGLPCAINRELVLNEEDEDDRPFSFCLFRLLAHRSMSLAIWRDIQIHQEEILDLNDTPSHQNLTSKAHSILRFLHCQGLLFHSRKINRWDETTTNLWRWQQQQTAKMTSVCVRGHFSTNTFIAHKPKKNCAFQQKLKCTLGLRCVSKPEHAKWFTSSEHFWFLNTFH